MKSKGLSSVKIDLAALPLLLWSILIGIVVRFLWNRDVTANNWDVIIAWLAVIQFFLHFVYMFKHCKSFKDFRMWFVIFLYLFMCGKQILGGIFDKTDVNGILVYRRGYDYLTMYKSSLFIILSIQIIFFGLFCRTSRKMNSEENICECTPEKGMYSSGLLMALVCVPSQLYVSYRQITSVRANGSYLDMATFTGLTDDFAMMLVPALIYIICSGVLNKRECRILVTAMCVFYVIMMVLTGDRRYPIVSIIVLFLTYLQATNTKLKFRFILYVFASLILLNIFTILRNTRVGGLTSVSDFFGSNFFDIFDFSSTFFETLNEFGISFFAVCLGFMYFPQVLGFRYGATLFVGTVRIVPLGFMYSGDWFDFGHVAARACELMNTHVGGALIQDAYANFGWLSLLFLFLFSLLLVNLFSSKRHSSRTAVAQYYILFYALIHLCRTSFTEVLRTAVWGIYIPLILQYIIQKGHNLIRKDK